MGDEKKHFRRAVKKREAETLLKAGVKDFYMPESAFKRMPSKTAEKIEGAGGRIIIEKAAGRPLSVGMEKIIEIVELHNDNRTFRQIEEITGIPKSTAHYIIKYAQRQKIKKGKKVVYL
ncbi:MAG TPA: hypothetical protein VFF09_00935 [archaeon]|nr:hypothetical protein [archaeon]